METDTEIIQWLESADEVFKSAFVTMKDNRENIKFSFF